jgi:four helix bundle protein
MATENLLDHERLTIYQKALDFVAIANELVKELPKGNAHVADQLNRAGLSIPLNIAEGAGEFSPKEKARFYRIARRSATECAAVLDVCHRLELVDDQKFRRGRELIIEVVRGLTAMAKRFEGQGQGRGQGRGQT